MIKRIYIEVLGILIIGSLMGCGRFSDKKSNPLKGKNTDERIIMCLEETYPEHQFNVIESFDKKRGIGVFSDENGIEFDVRDIIYDNRFHFGCRDEYLSTILKQENFIEKVEEIVTKYNQKLTYDNTYISVDIIWDENNQISDTDIAKMFSEILNSVDVPQIIHHKNREFSTGKVNYYTLPAWGVIQCYYQREGIGVGTQFYFENKTEDLKMFEDKIAHLVQRIMDENQNKAN